MAIPAAPGLRQSDATLHELAGADHHHIWRQIPVSFHQSGQTAPVLHFQVAVSSTLALKLS